MLQSRNNPHQAALCFTRCCEILQAQIDDEVIATEQYITQRSDLMVLWAERVRALQQPDAFTVVDDGLGDLEITALLELLTARARNQVS